MARRRTGRFIKTLVILLFLTLLWLQLHIIRIRVSQIDQMSSPKLSGTLLDAFLPSAQPLVSYVNRMVYSELHLRNVTNSVNLNMTSREGLNLSDIKIAIDLANAEEKIWNYAQFGALEENDVVIVVQVHTRLLYLRHLISSLQKAKYIDKVLLIFSHDVYYPEINALIQAIDFCKVLQIFYPFSIQLHPNSFPGQDFNDCPRDIKKEKAVNIKCNNANFPDLYGHYREAKFTQTKHHWWWKINHVFDGLRITRNHTGLVLFLEEDHYVVEDFLHSLALLEKTRRRECRHCNVLSLGTYVKLVNYGADAGRAEIWQWISSKHNMGMAFNSVTWKEIKGCAEKFCFFDDYNWDWSLQYISATCLQHKLIVMLMKAPRVYHIGECGVHHKKKDCTSNSEINKVLRLSTAAVSHLYPKRLLATHSTKRMGKIPKGNGGWGDIRDRQLCMWHANITDIRDQYRHQIQLNPHSYHCLIKANAIVPCLCCIV